MKMIKNTALILMLMLLPGVFNTSPAWADSRQEAQQALERLRKADLHRHYPEETKSIEATFDVAESYHKDQKYGLAERFFLLASQKIRVLETYAGQHAPATAAPQSDTGEPPRADSPPPSEPAQPAPVLIPEPQNAKTEGQNGLADETELTADQTVSDRLVGASDVYTVSKGDTLRLVAAKLGVSRQHLLKVNKLDPKATLKVGQHLKYNNRKIIPQRLRDGIIVNIPDRTLYYFQQGRLVRSLPVALGTATKNEKYVWQTPTGKFRITAKQKDPTWYVPPSIQTEMEEQGKEVIISIPPGPDNPLGKYAIKTSIPGILIHSTTKPWSIYSFASHGCIRVYPDQMEELFREIKINTPGEIIYKPVKLAVTEQGRIFLEVHQDVYGRHSNLASEVRSLIEKKALSDKVDWKKVENIIKQKQGIAEDVTL